MRFSFLNSVTFFLAQLHNFETRSVFFYTNTTVDLYSRNLDKKILYQSLKNAFCKMF